MQEKHILLKTNFLICILIVAGFMVTALLSYQTNYQAAIEGVEQICALTSEGIVNRISTMFAKPVNMSLTMAHDSLLIDYLKEEEEHLDDEQYIETISGYLSAYKEKYGYDSVFLVSAATQRYYNFNGVDRILTKDNRENKWYYSMLASDLEYSLVVDNDEVANANNDITIFVNCKIKDADGKSLGVIGVGLRVDDLQNMLKSYEKQVGVKASLIDEQGIIQVSPDYNGYQNVSLFDKKLMNAVKEEVLGQKEGGDTKDMWLPQTGGQKRQEYVVFCYIPELSWHLVVEQDTKEQVLGLTLQAVIMVGVIAVLLALILVIVTKVIKSFNTRITNLTKEKEKTFRNATEQLYDNIYEINITKNCAAGTRTKRYFESLGVPPDVPYDMALAAIAEKQIKEEFRAGYIQTFTPENVLKEHEKGNNHLCYDFMISENGKDYYWMRIDAYIYKSAGDGEIRMFTYRKNIDEEKKRELDAKQKVQIDEMTGLYTKTATQQHISGILSESPGTRYAFYIFDIDNFKQANDRHGHAFGDYVILTFVSVVKKHFRESDIIGRIGGDEFAAFIKIPDRKSVVAKAEELSRELNRMCEDGGQRWQMTASIGIAVSPEDGTDFETLYKNADTALYQTKQNGRNGVTFYGRR